MGSKSEPHSNQILRLGVLAALLLALLFALVFFNILSCAAIHPSSCDVYYSIFSGGKPKILIVYGDSGLGDPQALEGVLRSPRIGARVSSKHLDTVSLPNLMDSQLVIVERARKMDIKDIRMFQDYVTRGGKLVWIGDAGSLGERETDLTYFLKYSERKEGGSADYIGPWARKSGDRQGSLDYLLGVNFRANYCEISQCKDGTLIGHFDIANSDKQLVYGLADSVPFYGDFSLVAINESSYQTTLAYLDYGAPLTGKPPAQNFWLRGERVDFGQSLPIIVSSGVGSRVAYYAFAPEYFVGENMPFDKNNERIAYWGIIENLYFGMLY